MLVDSNKIDAAITLLRKSAIEALLEMPVGILCDPNFLSAKIARVQAAIRLLTRCVNEGYGDRSEPTTYAHVLEEAKGHLADGHSRRTSVLLTMEGLGNNQVILEVAMSDLDLLNIDIDDGCVYETVYAAIHQAISNKLEEDLPDVEDDE